MELLPELAAGWRSGANGINDDGVVVGWSESRPPDQYHLYYHATLWRNGAVLDLGTLGGPQSWAYDVNSLGQVVGASDTSVLDSSGYPIMHAFLWEQGRMTDLGSLGRMSYASAINDAGQIVGASDTKDIRGPHPVLWQDGKLIDLGLGDALSGTASDINNRGEVVGSRYMGEYPRAPGDPYRAFVWRNGVETPLPNFGGDWSYAGSISDSGVITGWCSTAVSRDYQIRCLWSGGVAYPLQPLAPEGFFIWSAGGSSSDGHLVGVASGNGLSRWGAAVMFSPIGEDNGPLRLGMFIVGPPMNHTWVMHGQVWLSGGTADHPPVRVALRSSHPKVIPVPPYVTIGQGQRTRVFRLPVRRPWSRREVTITATYAGRECQSRISLGP